VTTQPQRRTASLAQIESHATAQQNESTEQTVLQHVGSLQPGVPDGLATQQSLLFGGQLAHWILQFAAASLAQIESHMTLQQNESRLHTRLQHVESLQPGVPFGLLTQQSLSLGQAGLPPPEQHEHKSVASPAQMLSQVTAQQNESTAQTVAVHAASLQPGAPVGSQQLQPPPPPAQRSMQNVPDASPAQIVSHATAQQNESAAHTAA
jgi:hypothetical protein